MAKSRNWLVVASVALVSALIVACGSPDLASLKPSQSKHNTLVLLVNKPSTIAASQLKLSANTGAATFAVVHVSAKSLLQSAKTDLNKNAISSCMIIGDDLQANVGELGTLSKRYPHIQFEVLSNTSVALSSGAGNVHTVDLNMNAVGYSIGWLVGTWAAASQTATKTGVNTPIGAQPVIGFVPGQLSTDAQKAFFAGLYTIDPGANVVPMMQKRPVKSATNAVYGAKASSNIVTSVHVGAVVVGSKLDKAAQQSITSRKVPIFALSHGYSALSPAIRPGTLQTSEIDSFFQQFATGHWLAHDENVIGMSSVAMDPRQMPAGVMSTWSAVEPIVFNQPNLWQSNFQKLPQHTLQKLQSEFGIA